jgi:N-acetylglucosamine-6-phosphate deacetylase
LHHRNPGIIGLLGSSEDLPRPYYGIICDGVHVHKSCVKLAYQSHPKGAILVTDAMSALGLPDGTYEWTNSEQIVKEGIHLRLVGTDRIAGSAVTLDECVRNLVAWTKASLGEAIECVTSHPADLLHIGGIKGSLKPGAHADLVVLDDEGCVWETWKMGFKVFDKGWENI